MKLCFPDEVLDQHLVMLGKTGSGKSSALRHIVEHLLQRKKRVCIIDPKGDWWGLKSSQDGKGAGYPVIAFGDFKEPRASDVPINAQSGKHIAELITSGNRPCIIGFRGWMTSHMVQFWIDFASGIFNANSGELYLVGDEFHNFAPKGKIMDPQAGKCLHWSNRLMAEGRGLGIVCLIASQRPQKVHNDTLTSCETLVAMRVVHKADRDAVQAWIEGCGDKAQGAEVLNALAGMPRGEAYVWSPEVKFGPKRLAFPMFTTFDSFAPPQLQKHVVQQGWADVDLTAVKDKLARVIEEHKANDPTALKREVIRLKAELAKKPSAAPVTKTETKVREVPMLTASERTRLTKLVKAFEKIGGFIDCHQAKLQNLVKATNELRPEIQFFKSKLGQPVAQPVAAIAPAQPRPAPVRRPEPLPTVNGHWQPSKCARAILTVLVQATKPITRKRIALWSGYSISSGGFSNALSELRTNAVVQDCPGGLIAATDHGADVLGEVDPMPTGEPLRHYWFNKLSKCAREILKCLSDCYPEPLGRATIADRTGYSVESGGFSNALSELRGLELITDEPDRTIKASEELFT